MIETKADLLGLEEDLGYLDLPMKALLIEKDGERIYERYWNPIKEGTLLKYFSCAKSMTMLAVGLLAEEGQIHLDAPISLYFPEYSQNAEDPWFSKMTIRNMLEMRTCYSKTTYNKTSRTENWVESFFKAEPSHPPGTIFRYDTSSAHTLCALVEKITHKDMLTYLKDTVLDDLGFSRWSYLAKDPFGTSMGGSGLMVSAEDMMKVGNMVMGRGVYRGERFYPGEFLEEATTYKVSPYFDHNDLRGYGYMTWMIPGGFAFFGMGSQWVLMYPELSLVIVTAADTQKIPGADVMLRNALYRRVVKPLGGDYMKSVKREGMPFLPYGSSSNEDDMNGRGFRFKSNSSGFETMSLKFGRDSGTLRYRLSGREYSLPFGMDGFCDSLFPGTGAKCTTFGSWLDEDTLYIKSWLSDDFTSSVTFKLFFGDDFAVAQIGKTEEVQLREYNGIFNLEDF
ncbi:MAG: beta-lactamase family protein [Lachnospiraceae bacterium]|nr:beta-lactamase family protein [Lachnospiraceae bacterium]